LSNKQKNQRQWISHVLGRYEEVEKLKPKVPGLDDEWPEWVCNLLGIIMGVSHPGLNVKRAKKWKAKDLGRLIGRQYAYERLLWGEVPLSPRVRNEEKQCATWAKKEAKKILKMLI
jgi:hypothetical protein